MHNVRISGDKMLSSIHPVFMSFWQVNSLCMNTL